MREDREWMNDNQHTIDFFPGRWVGGVTMILGPILLCIGIVLRMKFNFFFPDQLEAFQESPTLITVAYSTFLAGNLLMWPAIITLVKQIAVTHPRLALWGGLLTIFGLFARTFHAGIDHLAFQIVAVENVDVATQIVADSYGAFHIISTLNLAIMMGWIVLAIGTFQSKVLHIGPSIALGLMSALPLGVLKGTTTFSMIATGGLCIAFIPLGLRILKNGPMPSVKKIITWTVIIFLLLFVFFYFGRLG